MVQTSLIQLHDGWTTPPPQQPATSFSEYNSCHMDVFELLRSWATLDKNPADKVELVCSLLSYKCSYITGSIFIELGFTVRILKHQENSKLYSNCKDTAAGIHLSPTRWKMKFKYQADKLRVIRHTATPAGKLCLLQAEMSL